MWEVIVMVLFKVVFSVLLFVSFGDLKVFSQFKRRERVKVG